MDSFQNCDSPGYDIIQFKDKTPEELYQICQFIPNSEGFNSNGWIKFYCPETGRTNEPGCTLYKIKKQSKQLFYELPEIWCKTDREDVIEFLKMTFGDRVKSCSEDPVEELTKSSCEMVIVVKENVEFANRIVEKMQHALAHAQVVDWDVISFCGTGELTDEFPKIVPIVTDPNACFAITRYGAIKLKNKQNIILKTCFPHLVKFEAEVPKGVIVANNENYKFFLRDLEHNIKNSYINTFKTWECFGKKGLWIYVPDDHLANTNYEKNMRNALKRFTLNHLRDPVSTTFTKENGTDVLIVRNAGDFAEAGVNLLKYDHILEVGGGYGALANVILSSGYTGTYTIYDFQLMEKVFRCYIQKPFNFVYDTKQIVRRSKTLLISTWGISEMPSELVNMIIEASQPDGVYIIAQNVYEKRNNINFFSKLLGFAPVPYDGQSSKFYRF